MGWYGNTPEAEDWRIGALATDPRQCQSSGFGAHIQRQREVSVAGVYDEILAGQHQPRAEAEQLKTALGKLLR